MEDLRLKVVTTRLPLAPPAEFDKKVTFRQATTDEELRALVRGADVLYSWKIPENVPAETPNLRWIQLPSAGADHVRNLPMWGSQVLLTGSMGVHAVPMSEHFFAMLLALTRKITTIVRAQRRREWSHSWQGSPLHLPELRGKNLGIVGWGKIGDAIAHQARSFGMRVIGTRSSVMAPRDVSPDAGHEFSQSPWLEPLHKPADVVYPAAQLNEVLSQSDIVVVLVPLTRESRNSFGDAEFHAMKRGALFFNLGRGQVVNEASLVSALQSGKLGGAGLDVFEKEPLHASSPLWQMENVIVSPHLGGLSDQTNRRTAQFFFDNLRRFLDGAPLLNLIDREYEY